MIGRGKVLGMGFSGLLEGGFRRAAGVDILAWKVSMA
jgi:hypothetical protein